MHFRIESINIESHIARFILLACLACLYSPNGLAVNPFLDWQTIESENFLIHFASEHKTAANRAAAIAEKAHQRLSKELNWQPAEKTELVLSDESDSANGYATPLNINRSVIFMSPPSGVGGLEDFDDWLTTLITHEYTHILHLDKAHRTPADLRKVFGRFLLLFPNVFEPSWVVEGLATHKETDQQRGIGRGQSSLFAMMMRAETMNGIKPVSQVNLPITTWPGGATRYLYGVYFMRFISEEYGEDKIQAFIEAYSDNLLPFAINTTFKGVFGKDVTEMWSQYELWLEARFGAQIEKIKKAGIKTGEPITTAGYYNQPVRTSEDRVYYIRNAGNHQSELVRFKAGEEKPSVEVLTEVHDGTDFVVNNEAGILLTQPEVCEEYSLYRDLYIFDEKEEELERITECGRYIRAVWGHDGKSIIALHQDAGVFELHRLDTDGKILKVLWQSNNGNIISQFDVSPDGRQLVAAVWRQQGGWNLEFFDLETFTWNAITRDTKIQAYPVYATDGSSVTYSADYEGVFNLYRYDLNTKQHYKITNVTDGAFQSSEAKPAAPLYYVGYTAKGTDIYKLDNTDSIETIETTEHQKLKPYDYKISQLDESEYSPWPSLRPRWWFPALALDEDSKEVGFTTAGNDGLGIHNYFLTLAYETENSIPLGSLVYSYSNRFTFAVARSNNIYRNSDGSFNRARPTDTIQTIFAFPYTQLLTAHNFLLAAVLEKDSDHTLASTAAPAPDFEDNLLGVAWLYNSARHYPLSVSVNDGLNLRLVAEDSDTFSSDYTGQVYTLDWKQYIRTGDESVIAFRLLQGWGTESPNPFRLGGEDTGVSLALTGQTGTSVFAVREYALRGYDEGLPQLRGRRAQIISAEWRFPIERVERGIMAPPVGLMQWSGAVFVDSGAAYNLDSADKYYTGAGVEINADLNLFYLVPVRARLGYAHGFDEVIGDDRVYLSVGASF